VPQAKILQFGILTKKFGTLTLCHPLFSLFFVCANPSMPMLPLFHSFFLFSPLPTMAGEEDASYPKNIPFKQAHEIGKALVEL